MPQRNFAVGVLTNSGVSNPVNELITSYAYDRLLGKPDIESTYAEKLAKLRAELDKGRAGIAAETQKRAQRTWQLKHERAAYAGRYENASFGTITIEERDGKLFASLGAMRSELEPYTNLESARVELIPAGGEVLQFVFGSGPRPDALKYKEQTFTRR
jgi:hypothetical protein